MCAWTPLSNVVVGYGESMKKAPHECDALVSDHEASYASRRKPLAHLFLVALLEEARADGDGGSPRFTCRQVDFDVVLVCADDIEDLTFHLGFAHPEAVCNLACFVFIAEDVVCHLHLVTLLKILFAQFCSPCAPSSTAEEGDRHTTIFFVLVKQNHRTVCLCGWEGGELFILMKTL